MSNKRGYLEDVEEVKAVLAANPRAVFRLLIRNYNDLTNVTEIGACDLPAVDSKNKDEATMVCILDEDLRKFFPKSVLEALRRKIKTPGLISHTEFLALGPYIAKEIGRDLIIVHQSGSKDKWEAKFKEYKFLTY
jgi:hypothetical protein